MQRRLEIDGALGLMLLWMTLTHLPTVLTPWVNQPFGFFSAAEGLRTQLPPRAKHRVLHAPESTHATARPGVVCAQCGWSAQNFYPAVSLGPHCLVELLFAPGAGCRSAQAAGQTF